jgi:hypothetical protein
MPFGYSQYTSRTDGLPKVVAEVRCYWAPNRCKSIIYSQLAFCSTRDDSRRILTHSGKNMQFLRAVLAHPSNLIISLS